MTKTTKRTASIKRHAGPINTATAVSSPVAVRSKTDQPHEMGEDVRGLLALRNEARVRLKRATWEVMELEKGLTEIERCLIEIGYDGAAPTIPEAAGLSSIN